MRRFISQIQSGGTTHSYIGTDLGFTKNISVNCYGGENVTSKEKTEVPIRFNLNFGDIIKLTDNQKSEVPKRFNLNFGDIIKLTDNERSKLSSGLGIVLFKHTSCSPKLGSIVYDDLKILKKIYTAKRNMKIVSSGIMTE